MVLLLRLHLLPARVMAFHFHPRLGSVILWLVVPLVTVKAGLAADFLRPAMEKASRSVVAAVSSVARSSPGLGRFAFVLCRQPTRFGIADFVIAAADPFALAGSDPAAAGSAVAAGLAADSAATVFAVAGSCSVVVAADLACSVAGSVCSFAT